VKNLTDEVNLLIASTETGERGLAQAAAVEAVLDAFRELGAEVERLSARLKTLEEGRSGVEPTSPKRTVNPYLNDGPWG
jgi:hypothetical protein